ncbi:MAG: HAD family phosphatase [Ilumatobacteraceae bacterium]
MRAVDAVIFDLGGVLSRNGRISEFAARFPEHDADELLKIFVGDYGTDGDHSWHRLERGEITLDEHRALNKEALAAAGITLPPPPQGGAAIIFELNEPVVALVHELRDVGLKLGVLTNNVREFRAMWWELLPFTELFDDVLDSHEVGLRKPNPAIYRLALERLGVEATRAAFLDDVQSNVDAAAAVGLHGVFVEVDPTSAVAAVRSLAGLA